MWHQNSVVMSRIEYFPFEFIEKKRPVLKLENTGCLMAGSLISWFVKETHTWVVFHPTPTLFHCSIWIQGGGTKPPWPHPILRSPNATDLHFAPAAKTRVAFWRFHGLRHDGWVMILSTPLLRREFGNPKEPATPLNFYSSPCQIYDIPYSSSWWFQPLWKVLFKMGIFLK